MVDVVLRAEDIHKSYGKTKVLKGISFEVGRGETKVICGPSGAGKSTLLRCLNLLTRPDKGRVWLEDVELTSPSVNINKMRQRIGFVFQEFNLFNHLTALDNVMIGLTKVKKLPKDEARRIAKEALLTVHITEDLWNKYPAQLSGGQKQRVAIARALAMDPVIILYDEPTSALDPHLIGEVLEVMKELARRKVTGLVVTHEIGFALSVADEIMFMYNGKIVERGPPKEVVFNPKHEVTARFFKRISELYGGRK
ncbi:MAG: glutamine ABC transporter ATP-binding protein [Desulfurococcales archaeon ex4484_204]|nr:MAG: glutamine ABC transporter ATP-binding protein [Desulfurococcales archaeon ex4484_204]